MNHKRLLVGMSGSLAVLSMFEYLNLLHGHFSEIKVIMTHAATQFIPPQSFSMFTTGIYSSEFPLSPSQPNHVELARWAELFIVIPATANTLAQVAHGMASSLLTATILAYESEVIFFPNMNRAMWQKPSVQRNLDWIRQDGHRIVPPLEKVGFEYASKQLRPNLFLPSSESVLSILQLSCEVGK